MLNFSEFEKSLYHYPYSSKELKEAYELGARQILEIIKSKQIGMVVNGTCQLVVLEKDLNIDLQVIMK